MPSEYKQEVTNYKYAEIPEEPRYKKKKKKVPHIKSKHKHRYASALFDCGHHTYFYGIKSPRYYIVDYCVICGRINDITSNEKIKNSNLPVFKIKFDDLMFAKRINLEDISLG